jgi:hypothetical protein
MATAVVPARTRRAGLMVWVGLAAILLCAALLRLRLSDLPLERDEGEYAYAGQLMLHGIAPYKVAWNMKFPGTYTAYAAIMLGFGQSIRAIHMGVALVNAATTVLVFLLARRWFDLRGALVAGATFALLSLGEGVLGMAGHATHFVTAFAVAGAWLLFEAADTGSTARLFGSGLLFGLAFVMKQQGVFFALFGSGWLLCNRPTMRKLSAFGAGALTPPVLTGLILWQQGVFDKFWFWTFQYAREYASEVTLADGWDSLRDIVPQVVMPNAALWLIAAAGLILLWRRGARRQAALPLTMLLVFSFLAVCPGLIFRDHYFIVMLPAIALLAGAATLSPMPRASVWAWGAAMAISIWAQHDFLFHMTPFQACRDEYEVNPFPEAIRVADYLKSVTKPGSRIAVFGSEPEIYFYADRLPATGYLYTYGLMEKQPFALEMQNEMIRQLETSRPEYVVQVKIGASWLVDDDSPTRIFDWWRDYSRNYTQAGLVQIVSEQETQYFWGDAAANRPPSDHCLVVFHRKSAETTL